MEIIRQLVEPKSWSARDDVYIKAIPGRLIVRQTELVHARIELLLRKLGVEYHRS